jgi:hypothetical protein
VFFTVLNAFAQKNTAEVIYCAGVADDWGGLFFGGEYKIYCSNGAAFADFRPACLGDCQQRLGNALIAEKLGRDFRKVTSVKKSVLGQIDIITNDPTVGRQTSFGSVVRVVTDFDFKKTGTFDQTFTYQFDGKRSTISNAIKKKNDISDIKRAAESYHYSQLARVHFLTLGAPNSPEIFIYRK